MSEKPEALRLAEVLDLLWMDGQTPRQAAAELRRLHAECEHHKAWVAHITAENKSLEAQRDALLRALKAFANEIVPNNPNDPIWVKARAAIKAVEGEKE